MEWSEILKMLHVKDMNQLKDILAEACENEIYCQVEGYTSRCDDIECPSCHETLYQTWDIFDFVAGCLRDNRRKDQPTVTGYIPPVDGMVDESAFWETVEEESKCQDTEQG